MRLGFKHIDKSVLQKQDKIEELVPSWRRNVARDARWIPVPSNMKSQEALPQ